MRKLALAVSVFVLASGLAGTAALAQSASIDLQSLIDSTPTGGTLVLDPGTYSAPVEVDRPMTITGTHAAVVDAGGQGSIFTVSAADVTIDGITIRGSGDHLDREHSGVTSVDAPRVTVTNCVLEDVLFGVFLRTSPESSVADNVIGSKDLDIARKGDGIRLWESAGSVVERNTVSNGRDLVFWFTDDIVVRDNVVTNGRYGVHFMYSDRAVIEGNHFSHNSVGAFLMYSDDLTLRGNVMTDNQGPSGYAIGLKEIDNVTIENNRLVANRVGIYLDNTPSSVNAEGMIVGNLIAYNSVGVLFLPSVKRNTVTGNTFIDNAEQVGVTGTGTFAGNAWSYLGTGNYWSDYAGYDADGDGIGDVAFMVNDLYDTLTDRHPDLSFYAETPAAKAIDIAARMFPVLRPNPLVEDVHPLVDRPELATLRVAPPEPAPLPLLVVGALMLSLAVAVAVGPSGRRPSRNRRRGAVA